MVAYSFQRQFVRPIEDDVKLSTIRALSKRRHAREGDEVQLYCGMRTKTCFLIGRRVCAGAGVVALDFGLPERVLISCGGPINGVIDGMRNLNAFAKRDGFSSWRSLRDFFQATHKVESYFVGVIILWRPAGDQP